MNGSVTLRPALGPVAVRQNFLPSIPGLVDGVMTSWHLWHGAKKLERIISGDPDLSAKTGALSKMGFKDPIGVLSLSDGDATVLSAGFYLNHGIPPSHEMLGTLAWCHQRGRLVTAVRLVREEKVPLLHVRRVTDAIYEYKNHQQLIYQGLRAIQTFGIPAHQWKEVYDFTDSFSPEHREDCITRLLEVLPQAQNAGFSGPLLWEAAKLLLEGATAQTLAAISNKYSHPSQAKLRRELKAHVIEKKYGREILATLEQEKIPPDQWEKMAPEIKNYGIQTLRLAQHFQASPNVVLYFEGRADILERLSHTAIPPAEWADLFRFLFKRGISVEDYFAHLEAWEKLGYSWEEHFTFGISLRQETIFAQAYPPEVLRRSIELRGVNLELLASFPETTPTEQMTPEEALRLIQERYDYEIQYREREGVLGTLYQFKMYSEGRSRLAKPSLAMDAMIVGEGDILYVVNIQSDEYRNLPPNEQERWQGWKQFCIRKLEELAQERGLHYVRIATPYGILARNGILANAAMRNIMDVYLSPRELGYQLVDVPELNPHYFWEKGPI